MSGIGPGIVLVENGLHRAVTLPTGEIALEAKRDDRWWRIAWVKDEAVARRWVEP